MRDLSDKGVCGASFCRVWMSLVFLRVCFNGTPCRFRPQRCEESSCFQSKNPRLKQESHLSGSFSAFRATGNNSLTWTLAEFPFSSKAGHPLGNIETQFTFFGLQWFQTAHSCGRLSVDCAFQSLQACPNTSVQDHVTVINRSRVAVAPSLTSGGSAA